MPSKSDTTDRTSTATATVVAWVANLTRFQRMVLFMVGVIVILVPVANVVVNHIIRNIHPDTVPVIIAEGVISAGFLLIGLSAMIPPLGIWILSRVFRTKYLSGGEG